MLTSGALPVGLRVVSGSQRPCPACSSPFEEVRTADLLLCICQHCGGVWLDNAGSMLVAGAALSRELLTLAHDAAADGHRGEGYRIASPPNDGVRRCPVCADPLQLVQIATSLVNVDICRAHGTFFDKGELLAVHAGFENERECAVGRRRALSAIVHKFRPGK
jgi:Zn-finger nucleic acid-binding protein